MIGEKRNSVIEELNGIMDEMEKGIPPPHAIENSEIEE